MNAKGTVFLVVSGLFISLLHASSLERLEKGWQRTAALSETQKEAIRQVLRETEQQGLPVDGLTSRVLEGLAKRVEPGLILNRLRSLSSQLALAQTHLSELSLAEGRRPSSLCVEGLATHLSAAVSSDSLRSLRGIWTNPPTCQSFIKALEWDRLGEEAGINASERRHLLGSAIQQGLIEKLPTLWGKGRSLGLKDRQIFNVMRKGLDERLGEAQILSDFERVAELLDLTSTP